MASKTLHTMMVGATKVAVLLPTETYKDIATIVGIDPVATGTPSGADTSAAPKDLLKSGQALRIRVRYLATGATFGKTSDVLCDIDKAKTAVGELVGKTFKGGLIRTAYFSRRARLG